MKIPSRREPDGRSTSANILERTRPPSPGDAEQRLIASAIEEDRLRSIELRVEELMTSNSKVAVGSPSVYARKKYIQLNAAPKLKFCRKKTRQQRAG